THNDLSISSVNAGLANKIADNPASDSTPLYSSDGKYIAYRAQFRPGYESDRFRLMLYDRKTGEKKNLTENFDRWVGTFTWTPDSNQIFLGSEDKGESPISFVDLTDKPFVRGKTQVMSMGRDVNTLLRAFNDDLEVTQDGGRLLFTRMTLNGPNEIYEFDLSNMGV